MSPDETRRQVEGLISSVARLEVQVVTIGDSMRRIDGECQEFREEVRQARRDDEQARQRRDERKRQEHAEAQRTQLASRTTLTAAWILAILALLGTIVSTLIPYIV